MSGFHEAFIQPVGPGAILKDARETREMSLEQLAQKLHVSVAVLEAMEDNRFEVFDAPVYARGFIRQYAALVDIDPQPVLDAYAELGAGPNEPTPVAVAAPLTVPKAQMRFDWRKPLAVVTVAGLLIASYVYVGRRNAAVPTGPAAPVSAAEAPLVGEPPPTQPPAPSVDPDRVDAPSAGASRGVAVSMPAPTVTGDSILLRGVHETWVQIRDASGTEIFNDTVRAGELRTVHGAGPWRVYLRDGNSVEVRVGAHIVDAPGKTGAGGVVRYGLKSDGTVVP